jgi:hypothetical protein
LDSAARVDRVERAEARARREVVLAVARVCGILAVLEEQARALGLAPVDLVAAVREVVAQAVADSELEAVDRVEAAPAPVEV